MPNSHEASFFPNRELKLQIKDKKFLTKIAIGFGLASAALSVVGTLSYQSLSNFIKISNEATDSRKVIEKLEEVLSQMKDAETGQRGYIITGKEPYLEPYNAALKVVSSEFHELRRLTAANPKQQRQLDKLEPLIAQKIAISKQLIDLRRQSGFEAAQRLVMTNKGKHLMDDIRKIVHKMENAENVLLVQRNRQVSLSARRSIFTCVYGILVSLFILTGIYYIIYREISIRKQAEQQVNLLQTLMLAIGETENFNEALEVVLRKVSEFKDWNYAEAWVPCPQTGVLTCSPAYCNRPSGRSGSTLLALEQFRRVSEELIFTPGKGMPGRVWSSKQPEWQEDISQQPETIFVRTDIAKDCGLRTALGIPLIVNKQVLAVLVFFKFEFDKKDRRLIESISAVSMQLSAVIQRKQAEEALKETEERFRQLSEAAFEGIVISENGRVLDTNTTFAKLLGYALQEVIGMNIPEFIALEERELVKQMISKQVDTPYQVLCLRKNGTVFPAEIRGQALRYQGRTVRVTALQDISKHKQSELALQQANEKLQFWVSDLEQRNREIALLSEMSDILQACLTVSEAYRAIAHFVQLLFPHISGGVFTITSSKNLVEAVTTWGQEPLNSQILFSPNECWALRRGRSHYLEQGDNSLICDHVSHFVNDLDNSSVDFCRLTESLCVPMMAQGEAIGVLHLTASYPGEFTEAKRQLANTVCEHIALALANLKLRETLQNQSIRDSLTGLFNRRYLEESLERELQRAGRKQQPVGIIMLDVDHFKRFNDTFGHDAGDAVLRELGSFLKKSIRGSDIACRYGGEELTLILPEASLEITKQRAETIREQVKQLMLEHRRQSLGVITLSLGVACFPEHGKSGEAVIHAADAALYCAKREGRDRVVCA